MEGGRKRIVFRLKQVCKGRVKCKPARGAMSGLFTRANMEVDKEEERRVKKRAAEAAAAEACVDCGGVPCECEEAKGGGGGGARGSNQGMEELRREMANLKMIVKESDIDMKVGEGDRADSVTAVMARSIIHLGQDMAVLKGTVYRNYEVPKGDKYLKEAKEGRQEFYKRGGEVKGTGKEIGTPWGWAGARMMMKMAEDGNLTKEEKEAIEGVLFRFMGTAGKTPKDQGATVDVTKKEKFQEVMAYVEIVETRDKDYMTFGFRDEFKEIEKMLEKAMTAGGARKKADRPPAGVVKDLKKALAARNKWGKGKGKGQ